MTTKELVKKVSERTELPESTVKNVLDSFTDTVVDTVNTGDKVLVYGFGKFDLRTRKGSDSKRVHFKSSSALRESLGESNGEKN